MTTPLSEKSGVTCGKFHYFFLSLPLSPCLILTWWRGYVTIAHCGHSDHNPVECSGDGGESRVIVDLNEVREAADDDPTDTHEEDEESKFFIAMLKSVGDSLKTRRMAGKF